MRNPEKSIPKIRFSGFESKWKKHNLGELLSLSIERNDGTYNRNDVLAAALGTELQKKQIFFGLKATDESVKNYRVIRPGDIVYTKSPIRGFPNGIVRASKGVWGIVPTLYCVYHSKDEIDANIIQAYFEDKTRLEDYLKPLVNVGARNNVNITDAGFLEGYIFLPADRKEQEAIIEFLSSIDEVIAASEQEVANLETQKKAVMKKIFSQEVRFKRKDGTDFPEWEEKVFTDVAQLINGRAYSADEMLESGKYVILRVGNLFSNNEYFYSDLELDADKYIEDGDLIYAWSATFGPRIYHGEKCIYHYHIWKVIPCAIDKNYLLHFMTADVSNLQSELNGGTMKHITKEIMEKRIVPLPSAEEQHLIAEFLSNFDEAIAAAKKELELWKELKKGLLQQMFV